MSGDHCRDEWAHIDRNRRWSFPSSLEWARNCGRFLKLSTKNQFRSWLKMHIYTNPNITLIFGISYIYHIHPFHIPLHSKVRHQTMVVHQIGQAGRSVKCARLKQNPSWYEPKQNHNTNSCYWTRGEPKFVWLDGLGEVFVHWFSVHYTRHI